MTIFSPARLRACSCGTVTALRDGAVAGLAYTRNSCAENGDYQPIRAAAKRCGGATIPCREGDSVRVATRPDADNRRHRRRRADPRRVRAPAPTVPARFPRAAAARTRAAPDADAARADRRRRLSRR